MVMVQGHSNERLNKNNKKETNNKIIEKMKKLILTTAIILGLSMTTFAAPNGGGLFKRGETPERSMTRFNPGDAPLVPLHEQNGNQNAETPLGTGDHTVFGLVLCLGSALCKESLWRYTVLC